MAQGMSEMDRGCEDEPEYYEDQQQEPLHGEGPQGEHYEDGLLVEEDMDNSQYDEEGNVSEYYIDKRDMTQDHSQIGYDEINDTCTIQGDDAAEPYGDFEDREYGDEDEAGEDCSQQPNDDLVMYDEDFPGPEPPQVFKVSQILDHGYDV